MRAANTMKQDSQNKPVTLTESHKQAVSLVGHLFAMHDQVPKARVIFEALRIVFPDDPQIIKRLGYVYLIAGAFRQAADLIDETSNRVKDGPESEALRWIRNKARQALERETRLAQEKT